MFKQGRRTGCLCTTHHLSNSSPSNMSTKSTSFTPSLGSTMFDVDGFSVSRVHGYSAMRPQPLPADLNDFGFDPVLAKSTNPVKIEQTCALPKEDNDTFGDFSMDPAKENLSSPIRPLQFDRIVTQSIPNTKAAILRYGRATPPRSNSESSIEKPIACICHSKTQTHSKELNCYDWPPRK